MAQINLLPWRERLREERKREFLTIMVGVLIIAGGLIFLVDRYFRSEINTQIARNDFIRTEIQQLDERVSEINQLQQQKQEIRARMNVIQNLQGSRPVIVRIFDELVRALPQGVYFSRIQREDTTMSIDGVAESYAMLTELMRRLDSSDWFAEADLRIISARENQRASQGSANSFTLSLTLESPLGNEEEEGF
ncbi:MAG: PilN domain-containing protein [Pseudohongiellaceae bacterium]